MPNSRVVRPRIVQVIPADGLGGVEIAARSMVDRTDLACDFQLLLISGAPRNGACHGIIGSRYRSLYDPRAYYAATRRLVQERPDLIICSLWRSVPVSLIARLRLRKARLVLFIHNAGFSNLADRLLYALAIRFADNIWVDSRATLEARVAPRLRNRARTISFVTTPLKASVAHSHATARFVSWGRMSHQKGVDRSIALIERLTRRGIDAKLDLWGPDNGEQTELMSLSHQLGLSDRVTFRGPTERDNLPAIASDNCFYLQLSRREGMAMAVVEAMQLGLVPVVTAVGEMKNYCQDGRNAIICDPDALENTADRIVELLENPRQYRDLAAGAIEHWLDAPNYAEDVCEAAKLCLQMRK